MNFFKSIFLIGCFVSSVGAFSAINPENVIKDWQHCQAQVPLNANCMAIGETAMQISQLADSMELNPQHFGIDIMELQDKLSSMPNSLQKTNLNHDLQLRLAVIGWLRSPR
jgi:hypothetical protein